MILGISPGTNTFGYVLLHEDDIISWGTKAFKGKWSKNKLRWILSTLEKIIDERGITHVAIKLPNIIPISKSYTQMLGGINILIDSKHITAEYFALDDIKEFLSPDTYITKQRMVEILWHQYPELLAGATIPKIVCNPYYIKLFESVGAAHLAIHKGV